MPVTNKTLFEAESGENVLLKILTKLNQVMAGANRITTVEELQSFIDNLNRVYLEIKQISINI
jgi:hypothetical protein